MADKKIGIYQISSKVHPERIYIGSSVDLRKRWHDHKSTLIKNTHANAKMQNHVNKYGIDDLVFKIIHICSREDLLINEQWCITCINPYFNISPTAGNTMGRICSESTKAKIALKAKGRKVSDETRQKMSIIRKRHKHSDATKLKMSKSALGNKNAVGVIPSEETREKIRQSKIGNTYGFPVGHSVNVGRKATDEARKNMSEAQKRRYVGYDVDTQYLR